MCRGCPSLQGVMSPSAISYVAAASAPSSDEPAHCKEFCRPPLRFDVGGVFRAAGRGPALRRSVVPVATMGAGKRAAARRGATRDNRVHGATDDAQGSAGVEPFDQELGADAAPDQAEDEQTVGVVEAA